MTWQQLELKMQDNVKRVTLSIANSFEADVSKAPVVTARLKNAWRVVPEKDGYAVVNHMEYAPKIWVGKPNSDTWKVPMGLHPIYTRYKEKYKTAIIKGAL